jgi:hypothetical protein
MSENRLFVTSAPLAATPETKNSREKTREVMFSVILVDVGFA